MIEHTVMSTTASRPLSRLGRFDELISGYIEDIVIASRYLLVPLVLAMVFRIIPIIRDFYHIIIGTFAAEELSEHILQILQLLDVTMIANLIWLISVGSFYVFIATGHSGKKRPACLEHLSTGLLKEKMAGSLIGVSSVHLLQYFLHLGTAEGKATFDWNTIAAMSLIHVLFIVGLLAFCKVNAADHHDHSPAPIPEAPHEAHS